MEPFKKPEIPTLKDSGKQPQLKIKGLAGGGLSFVDRLKQFKKKDLAFIFAGLGTLFMAPLAEHFMMSPDSAEQGTFKEGWNIRGDAAGFGTGQSPYEGGVSGLAPGSLLGGGGSDVITPLNVRDPSALIMGPGQSAPQPVTAPQAPPQAASPSKASGGDWKDALANAAGRGAKEAVKAASLPVPKIPLQGGLRGLGAVSGGGGGGYSLPAISASNVPNTAAGSNSLQKVSADPRYKGVAAPRGNAPNTGGLEALKKAAAGAAGEMNRGGSAASNLDTAAAASQALPGGGADGGGGGGAQGGSDKAPGGNQDKSSKQQGESLEFLIAKENAMKQLELDWELKKKKAMMWPNMKEKMFETFMTKGIAEPVSKMFADFLTGDGHEKAKTFLCATIIDKGVFPIPAGKVKPCGGGGVGKDDSSAEFCIDVKKDIYRGPGGGQENLKVGAGCWKSDGSTTDAKPAPETKTPPTTIPTVGGKPLNQACEEIAKAATLPPDPKNDGLKKVAEKLLPAARGIVSSRDALEGEPTGMCGAPAIIANPARGSFAKNIKGLQGDILTKLNGGEATTAASPVGKMMTALETGGLATKEALGKLGDKAANGGTDSRVDAVSKNLCGSADPKCDDATLQAALDGVHGKAGAPGPFDKIGEEGLATLKSAEETKSVVENAMVEVLQLSEDTNGFLDKSAAALKDSQATLLNEGFKTEVAKAAADSGQTTVQAYYADLRALVEANGAVAKSQADAQARQAYLNVAVGKAGLATEMLYKDVTGVLAQTHRALDNPAAGGVNTVSRFAASGVVLNQAVPSYPTSEKVQVSFEAKPTDAKGVRQQRVDGMAVNEFVAAIKAGKAKGSVGISGVDIKLPLPTDATQRQTALQAIDPAKAAFSNAGEGAAGHVQLVNAALGAVQGLNGQAAGQAGVYPENSAARFVSEIMKK